MKTLRLIWLRTQQYFYNNKLVFILFITGGILCSLTFIYFYGNFITSKSLSGANEYVFRKYDLYFQEPLQNLTGKQLETMKKYSLDKLTLSSYVSIDKLQSEDLGESARLEYQKNGFFIVDTSLVDHNYISTEAGRVEFTEKEVEDGEYVVILPSDFLVSPSIPQSIKIFNKEYKIIGITGSSNDLHIPRTVFEKEKYDIYSISILLTKEISNSENTLYENELKEAFSTAELYGVSTIKNSINQQAPTQLFRICLIYFLAMLSFVFLLKYLIDTRRGEDIIYSLVGASKKIVIKIMIMQNLLLSLATGIIGVLLHLCLKSNLFELINIYPNVSYNFWDYFIIIFSMCFISAIIQIPFIWIYYRYSLIKLKQKYVLED